MLLIGLDLGTSAVKAIALDPSLGSAGIVASASKEHPLHTPREGWSEQDPADWWVAACAAIGELLALPGVKGIAIAGIGLSGQMHGSVMLDRAGLPVRRALLWNDQRTAAECGVIEKAFGGKRGCVALVGNAALTGFTLPKLLWVRRHEPVIWSRVAKVMLPKDYLALKLTGVSATDVGDASGTLLFDVASRQFSGRACELVGIEPGLFPEPHESSTVVGQVSGEAAAQTGLPVGVPVIIGSGDNMTAAIGAGVVSAGTALAVLGTSGVILVSSDGPEKDLGEVSAGGDACGPASGTASGTASGACGRMHTMCAAAGSRSWALTGCTLSAGGALRWFRDTLAPGVAYDQLMAEAASVPIGCEGLVFAPQLTGERCPHPDPQARGGFLGLTSRHTRAHLARAVIEGVTFTMGQILGIAGDMGVKIERVRLSGGGNRSAFWRQMQADVYGLPTQLAGSDEGGCALGAALLAGVGVGRFASVEAACQATLAVQHEHSPDRRAQAEYARAAARFGKAYGAICSLGLV